jgi:hypothetical protein
MDDMKISHFNTKKADDMIKWLCKMHEHLVEDGSGAMKTCRGKAQVRIRMTLDFSAPGQVKVTMLPHVKEIFDDFAKQSKDIKMAVTPTAEHLFKIDDDAGRLTEEMGKVFHKLFLTKRA